MKKCLHCVSAILTAFFKDMICSVNQRLNHRKHPEPWLQYQIIIFCVPLHL